jgi:uncharacterized repeat protein (TIGR01451 family)
MSKTDGHLMRSGGRVKLLQTALSVATALTLVSGSAAAQATQQEREPEALVVSATILTWGQARPQTVGPPARDPNTVSRGDVVEYRLVFTNITGAPVNNIQFTDPLPEGMHYLQGTAGADREDVDVEFSLDHGVSYSEQPMVEVVVDGQTELRPADPEDYTDIRWTVHGEVQPDGRVAAAFQVRFGPPEETGVRR